MLSKAQMRCNDKTSSERLSPKPAAENLKVARQQTSPAALIEQAKLSPQSLTPSDVLQLQRTIGNRAVVRLLALAMQPQPTKKKENKTGLPDNLKAGIESFADMPMDDVTVHYNSAKPAQFQALAYTQGTDIYLGPGQETSLPHEAWHVVQQKQGRVKPSMQLQGAAINDDKALEREADVMGEKALQGKPENQTMIEATRQETLTARRAAEWKSETERPSKDIRSSGVKMHLNSPLTIQLNGGDPYKISMKAHTILQNQKLPEGFKDTGSVYQGVLFKFTVYTESGNFASGKIKEIITPVSTTGIFKALGSAAQSLDIELNDGAAYDLNALPVGGKAHEGEKMVEKPSVSRSDVPETGESVVSQYFAYIKDRKVHAIEHSGYTITQTLGEHKLTVKREPQTSFTKHGFVSGGEGGGTFEIDI